MWGSQQLFGVEGHQPRLQRGGAEPWVQLSRTSEFLNYRASYWGCICMCTVTGRLCGQGKIRRCKVCSWSMWTAQTCYLSSQAPWKGLKAPSRAFPLTREKVSSSVAKLPSDLWRINRRMKQEPKLKNWFLADRSTQKQYRIHSSRQNWFLGSSAALSYGKGVDRKRWQQDHRAKTESSSWLHVKRRWKRRQKRY